MTTPSAIVGRARAVRHARRLNVVSIGYNTIEAFTALASGVAAGSVRLVGSGSTV